jgi:hypothetical protein
MRRFIGWVSDNAQELAFLGLLTLILVGLTALIFASPDEITAEEMLPHATKWAETHRYDAETITCVPSGRHSGYCDVSNGVRPTVSLYCDREYCRLNKKD